MANFPTEEIDQISESDLARAESAEQAALNDAQSQYLRRRVVALRAHLNQTQSELSRARAEVASLRMELEELREDAVTADDPSEKDSVDYLDGPEPITV